MNLSKLLVIWVILYAGCTGMATPPTGQQGPEDSSNLAIVVPPGALRLLQAYPEHIRAYSNGYIIWKSGYAMRFDTTFSLENPGIADMFSMAYPKGKTNKTPARGEDPGRYRNDSFFRLMYGHTEAVARKNLKTVVWLPGTRHEQLLLFNRVNGAADSLQKISDSFAKHPEWWQYLEKPGGTFLWRTVRGTNRLSGHAFGIGIDINPKHGNYWQWDCRCHTEDVVLSYRNKIPAGIVALFEKYGFIWGGKWYHYDTMHFEFRPELLL